MTVLVVILKIIGIVILAVLAIVAIVLIVPIRYRVNFTADGWDVRGESDVSWLLRALVVKAYIRRNRDGELDLSRPSVSVFGIDPAELKKKRAAKKRERAKAARKKKLEALKKNDPEKYKEMRAQARAKKDTSDKKAPDDVEKNSDADNAVEEDLKRYGGKRENRLRRLIDRVRKVISKLMRIYAKISGNKRFLSEKKVRHALSVIRMRMIKVFKHVIPRKMRGFCEFGFKDPSHTGELLAVLSAFYPLYGGSLTLSPNFREDCLKVNAEAVGRIHVGVLVWHALMVLACSDVRYAYRRYKELSSGKNNDMEEAA